MVDDARWMRRALHHARRGLGRTTPNPVVGACVVDRDGVVVGQGAHERAGEAHAEVHALDEAGVAARGATLYCTLEPCAHVGRTGPCTERIIAAGIRRVVAAMEDPFPAVHGKGVAALRARGIEVEIGVERAAAERLNQPFLTVLRQKRPFVILKAATSLDGRLAARPGVRTQLSSEAALRHAQQERGWVDALGVGSETVLVDDPSLTAREVYRERPLARVVFDRRLRIPKEARLWSTVPAGAVIIVTSPNALRAYPDRVRALEGLGGQMVAPSDRSLRAALETLPALGVQSLVLEGGAAVQQSAWAEGLVDYVQLYVAPSWVGERGVPFLAGCAFSPAALVDPCVSQLGPDVLIEGYVHRPD